MQKEKPKEPDFRSELLRQIENAVVHRDVTGGLRLAERARELLSDRNDPRTGLFRCLEANLFFLSGDYQKSLTSSRLAASLLAPFGETEDLARAYFLSGKALVSLGNYQEAETSFLDTLSLYRRCDYSVGQIDAANQLAQVYFIRAEYKSALKYLLDAVKLADRNNERQKLAYLWGNLGRVYTLLGNFKKAVDALRLNVEISGELGDEREKAKALLSLGYLKMQNDQIEKAEEYFDEAHLILVAQGMRREFIIYQTYLGELNLKRQDYRSARRFLNEAINQARELAPESSLTATPIRLLSEVELADGKPSAASRLAHKSLDIAKKIGESVEEGACLRALGQIAITGKSNDKTRKKARAFFNEALEIFDEIGARFEKAETLEARARCKIGPARRILADLFRASETYNKLGLTNRFEKTQDLINQSESAVPSAANKLSPVNNESKIITANRRLKKIITDIDCAARSELPVLLVGETGTGKDLLARYYHTMTGRKGEFVAVNCAAFPDTLLESELFGYRRGAFTGADGDKEGLLHRANGGTFFLDEIGELSLASQAKLLMVIETCRARPLGGTAEEILDIRIVAATNCKLATMVEENTFRRDLFYRLSGITFTIPPLTERPEDIPLLVQHFLNREGILKDNESVPTDLMAEFISRSWPGNVRQLESEIRKLALFSTIAREDELGDLAGIVVQNDTDAQTTSLFSQVEQFERSLILKALKHAGWNKSKAARLLAIHESTLRAKMKRYDLNQTLLS